MEMLIHIHTFINCLHICFYCLLAYGWYQYALPYTHCAAFAFYCNIICIDWIFKTFTSFGWSIKFLRRLEPTKCKLLFDTCVYTVLDLSTCVPKLFYAHVCQSEVRNERKQKTKNNKWNQISLKYSLLQVELFFTFAPVRIPLVCHSGSLTPLLDSSYRN